MSLYCLSGAVTTFTVSFFQMVERGGWLCGGGCGLVCHCAPAGGISRC